MQSSSKYDGVVVAAVAVVFCGLVARLAFLSADPTYPFWSGWVADEGRWVKTARDLVLFGEPFLDTALARTHLILAPVYQALSAAVFWVLGVGSVQARLLSVVAGLGILALSAVFLRRRLSRRATCIAVALLAVHPDLIYFGRVAIPEMTALFFELVAFTLLVGAPRSWRRAFLAGVATAVAFGVKGTTAPVLLAFAPLVLFVHRPTDPSGRWIRLAAFLSAIGIPAVMFLAIVGGSFSIQGGLQDILGFVDLDDPYGVLGTLFHGGWTIRVNLILMAVWGLGLVSWIRGLPEGEARAVFIGSVTWVAAWIVPWALLLYFPERYVMHIHLPLILALASGYDLLAGDSGVPHIHEAAERIGGWRRGVAATLIAVPAAAVSTPMLFSVIDVAGPTIDNLRFQILAIGGLSLALGVLLHRRWSGEGVVALGLAYPLGVGGLWVIGRSVGLVAYPFWMIDGLRTTALWAGLLAGGAALAVVVSRPRRGDGSEAVRIVGAFAAVIGVLWAGQGISKLGTRTFVQREVAEYLVANYPATEVVGTLGASSLLLSTPFLYQDVVAWEDAPDVLLVYWAEVHEELLDEHEIVREFDLDVGPGFTDTYRSDHLIRVYERR